MNAKTHSPPSGQVGLRRAVERGSRRSALSAFLFLAVAVLAAAAAAATLLRYLDKRSAPMAAAVSPVVVAARALPLGTTLSAEHLQVIEWPKGSLPDGVYGDVESLVGRVLVVNVMNNEPLHAAKLASADAGRGLAAVLPDGMLAVAVRVNDVVGVAGFIHPGDRVDVIVTMKPREETGSSHTSKVILQNILVLAVGKQVDRPESGSAPKPITATVATLMVTPEDAERLALAASRGNLLLALRNKLYMAEATTDGVTPEELLRGAAPVKAAAKASPPRATPAAASAPPPPKNDSRIVEILRGDRFEQRQFQERQGNP